VWIDVLSKSDLLGDVWELADSADRPAGSSSRSSSSNSASTTSGGADADAAASSSSSGGAAAGEQDPVLSFARLSAGLRVSSLTGDGVEGLKARVMAELQAELARMAAAAEEGGRDDDGGFEGEGEELESDGEGVDRS
jgi:hypothetical protein